jgi:hypothetical protein
MLNCGRFFCCQFKALVAINGFFFFSLLIIIYFIRYIGDLMVLPVGIIVITVTILSIGGQDSIASSSLNNLQWLGW